MKERTPCCSTSGPSLRSTNSQAGISPVSVRSLRHIEDQYGVYTEAVRARLGVGAVTYGDASLDRPTAELMEEAEAEALDIDGWGFFVWTRIQALKAKLAEIERRTTPST